MNQFEEYLQRTEEVGYIESIVHSIAYVSGIPGVRPREMVMAEGGQKGIVQSLKDDFAEVLMFDTKGLFSGMKMARTGGTYFIPVSAQMLGRIINPFGNPIDGGGPILGDKFLQPLEPPAPGISLRARVNRPLETGVTMVDLLIPLGYGQRELVIGDKKTGKTTFALQTMASQASKGLVCIYVSIGKRQDDIKTVENYLRKSGLFSRCIIVVASSADPTTVVYLAPYAGMAIAEYFRENGQDCVVVLDDLSNHAKFYREISLLSKKAPGRGSYPGDIFHLHAALMERAGNIKTTSGKVVSISLLPIAETLESDLSGYIQTNLMSMTDGHIFFEMEEFKKGQRPAINHGYSVSRVGNQTKGSVDKELAGKIRESLSTYKRALEIARFGVELPEQTKKEIALGEKIELIFNQDSDTIIPRSLQLFLYGLLFTGYWDAKNTSLVKVDLIKIVQKFRQGELKDIVAQIEGTSKLEDLQRVARNYSQKITQVLYV
jgi:F-type H+-transporting ATPase subunit alpha